MTKPNECEGTQCTSLTKTLKDHNYPLIWWSVTSIGITMLIGIY